mgnify:CR=1 FL=1
MKSRVLLRMTRHAKYVVLAFAVILAAGLAGCGSDDPTETCDSTTVCGYYVDVCCSADGDCYYDLNGVHYSSATAVVNAACGAAPDPRVAQSLLGTANQVTTQAICNRR